MMKQISKFFVLAVVMLSFTAATFAQVSATATVTANIMTPILMSKTTDMNFGNSAVTAALGTVILATNSTRTVTGGSTAVGGFPTAAAFSVTGAASTNFAVTLPAGVTTLTGPGVNMTVDTWVSNPSGTGTFDGVGAATVLVGATLHVGGSQTAGTYTQVAPFQVTVNYN